MCVYSSRHAGCLLMCMRMCGDVAKCTRACVLPAAGIAWCVSKSMGPSGCCRGHGTGVNSGYMNPRGVAGGSSARRGSWPWGGPAPNYFRAQGSHRDLGAPGFGRRARSLVSPMAGPRSFSSAGRGHAWFAHCGGIFGVS